MPARPAPLLALLLPLALVAASPAAGDTVRLRNGRSYEGVIAERTADGVRIRLAFGHLVLPHDQVLAIEKGDSALATYLERKAALESRHDASAAEWLALARWARGEDLAQGVREAATAAADLEPRLPGLEPLLRPFGIVLDEEAGRWLPFDEAMARRGLVRFEGEWISVAEQRRVLEERRRERELAAEEATARRLAALAAAMLAREEREARQERRAAEAQAGYPWHAAPVALGWAVPAVVIVPPVGFHAPHFHPPDHPRHPPGPVPPPGPPAPPPAPGGYGGAFDRVPGSLLPVSPASRPASSVSTRPAASSRR